MPNYLIYAILFILVVLVFLNIFILLKKYKNNSNDNAPQEIDKLKQDINNSLSTMTSSFNQDFTNLSKDVTRDMTAALTKVDEKVNGFNKQVYQVLNNMGFWLNSH